MEDDYIVNIRAVAQKFVLLQPRTDKAFGTVDIEFLIGFYHCLDIDVRKVTHLCTTWIEMTIFGFQCVKPCDGIII